MAAKIAIKFEIIIFQASNNIINKIPNANHTFIMIGDVMVRI